MRRKPRTRNKPAEKIVNAGLDTVPLNREKGSRKCLSNEQQQLPLNGSHCQTNTVSVLITIESTGSRDWIGFSNHPFAQGSADSVVARAYLASTEK